MAIHGLSGRDLDLSVRLALAGMSDTPDRDIVAWLRSGLPVEQRTRDALADAFESKKAAHTNIKVKGQSKHATYRLVRKELADLRIGREACSRKESLTTSKNRWEKATEIVADEKGKSAKSVERYITEARKVDVWIADTRTAGPELCSQFSDEDLAIAFLMAGLIKCKPEELVGPRLTVVVGVIRATDAMEKAARGNASLKGRAR
jgi:hypothetical protein